MTTMDRKYAALLLAVEEGSLSAASRKLHYSQSSISRMIQSLESDWGFRLIDRTPRGVQPTQECRQLLPVLQALRRETENLANQIQALQRIEAGKVRIATFSSVATYWLPNMISAFHRDYPQVDFELLIEDYNEIERLVLSGQADLGFLLLPIASQLECTLLYQDPLLAVLPQDHPKAQPGRPVRGVQPAPEAHLYHVGRLRHHGHGGEEHGGEHPARADPAAQQLPHRDPGPDAAGQAEDRTGLPAQRRAESRRQALFGLPDLPHGRVRASKRTTTRNICAAPAAVSAA